MHPARFGYGFRADDVCAGILARVTINGDVAGCRVMRFKRLNKSAAERARLRTSRKRGHTTVTLGAGSQGRHALVGADARWFALKRELVRKVRSSTCARACACVRARARVDDRAEGLWSGAGSARYLQARHRAVECKQSVTCLCERGRERERRGVAHAREHLRQLRGCLSVNETRRMVLGIQPACGAKACLRAVQSSTSVCM
eukprot:6205955-Pleurochrysis_carterae.AAC.2